MYASVCLCVCLCCAVNLCCFFYVFTSSLATTHLGLLLHKRRHRECITVCVTLLILCFHFRLFPSAAHVNNVSNACYLTPSSFSRSHSHISRKNNFIKKLREICEAAAPVGHNSIITSNVSLTTPWQHWARNTFRSGQPLWQRCVLLGPANAASAAVAASAAQLRAI